MKTQDEKKAELLASYTANELTLLIDRYQTQGDEARANGFLSVAIGNYDRAEEFRAEYLRRCPPLDEAPKGWTQAETETPQ
jgi:hypothetical protein